MHGRPQRWPDGSMAELAAIGPFFSVTTGPVAEDSDWLPVSGLYSDGPELAGLVQRLAATLGTDEERVAASIFAQGLSARLWSLSFGSWLTQERVPDLDPDLLLWRDDRGSLALHLTRVQGWAGADLLPKVAAFVVENHLVPLVSAVRSRWPLSSNLLWQNAVSALHGTATVLETVRPGSSRAAGRLLEHLRTTDGVRQGVVYVGRRSTCCLFYRLPNAGLCGDCVLDRVPRRGASPPREP
ncbi:MAG TPA: (2Fe-2S)-binding protein [Actinomycetales bacterium]|nr:(2Fe-2S)-binding protein [Actinomycetales bacterium]